jgi:NADPH:quinone reductase-like Zn-dependent oxidoreductase
MKAWLIDGSFGLDHLVLVERPRPQPGPGQVLVRIRAASLNYRDLVIARGVYAPDQPLPLVPVSDGAGEVVEIGAGVTRVAPGDRVIGTYMQRWLAGPPTAEARASTLGAPRPGVLAEYALLEAEGTVRVPEHLSFEEAATLPIAGLTAWHALFGGQPVKPGDSVLVQGTGGVSIFALQLARAAGARVIVTSKDDAKLVRARELGAHDAINYRTTPAWDVRARELTGGDGVDLVVDVAGGALDRSIAAVRPGGQVSLIGGLDAFASTLALPPVLTRNIRLQGISTGSRDQFEAMNRALARLRLRPVIDRVFPFERARDAYDALAAGPFGKIVVGGA